MNEKMNSRVLIAACVLLVLFTGMIVKGQSEDTQANYLITPTSVGGIRLGMTVAEARKVSTGLKFSRDFGDENSLVISVSEDNKPLLIISADEGLEMDGDGDPPPINEDGKIRYIEILDSRYQTAAGVHPGMTIADAEKKYGKLNEMFNFPHDGEFGTFTNQPEDLKFTFKVDGDFYTAGIYKEIPNCTEPYPPACSKATEYNPGSYIYSISIDSIDEEETSSDDDDGLQGRDVTSSAFSQKRPARTRTRTNTRKRRNYRRGRVRQPRRKKKTPVAQSPQTAPIKQVGVTMWLVRNERAGDTGARLLTQGKKQVSERVSLETVFQTGQKVRISIESPQTGYLYVFDRERKTDGSVGDPYMIFPTLSTRGGDNRITAGTLIEIPAQTDDPFYFEITPSDENYAGELITIIVSPTELPGLKAQNGPVKILTSTIENWEEEWEVATAVDELEGEKEQYTEGEREAGSGNRPLEQDEPAPETLFSVKVLPGRPILVNFEIKVEK